MNQTIFTAVMIVMLGIAASFPLETCNKLKDVKEGAVNYDLYVVKLKDPGNYKDAEYVINIVNEYQATLDQHASNVHEPSVKSQLELTENAGVLHGILSQQALLLVCSENRVESIFPDYPRSVIDPQDFGETKDVHIGDCSKLVVKEPYHGNNYSIIFKRKTSLNTLYHVISEMELAKLNDDTITFNYYHSIKNGRKITMVVGMNMKALFMVCKEKKVKQIKPNHDTSVINKRSTEAVSDQDIITPTTSTGHCGLPENEEEFSTFIFVYSETANLDKIVKSVKRTKDSAKVLLAKPIEHVHMIIFQMNRAAYLQACSNPEILLVEYAQSVVLNPLDTTTPTPQPTEAKHTDVCQQIDSLQDSINTYTVLLKKPRSVENKRKRCLKLVKKLKHKANKSNNTFYAITYPRISCQNHGNDVKLVARLNLKALRYVCGSKGLQISVIQT